MAGKNKEAYYKKNNSYRPVYDGRPDESGQVHPYSYFNKDAKRKSNGAGQQNNPAFGRVIACKQQHRDLGLIAQFTQDD